jgi:hypothetical protein
MNLMLTATCDSVDVFHQAYLATKHEFAEWCDSSRCVFAKIDDNNLIELFFDVDAPKLKAWLGRASTQELFKKNGFVPTRYTFTPLQMG